MNKLLKAMSKFSHFHRHHVGKIILYVHIYLFKVSDSRSEVQTIQHDMKELRRELTESKFDYEEIEYKVMVQWSNGLRLLFDIY